MDFTKFIYIIQKKCLYFPSLLQLLHNDPWEGLPSALNFNSKDSTLLKLHQHSYLGTRKSFYVNCWYMGDGESDSQWKIYGSTPSSLAVVTDFETLCDSIIDTKQVYGGQIQYYDQKKELTPEYVLLQAMVKRHAFQHEKEFRLVIWDHQSINKEHLSEGLNVYVNIKKLFKKIVIHPLAPAWFIDIVDRTLRDYGFDVPIEQSDLLEPLMIE